MVKAKNTDKLLQTLKSAMDRYQSGGHQFTVVSIAKEANVSRATANRDLEFQAAFKHAISTTAAANAQGARRRGTGNQQLVAELRRTINDMANVIQALNLAYERLQVETAGLRALKITEKSVTAPPPCRTVTGGR